MNVSTEIRHKLKKLYYDKKGIPENCITPNIIGYIDVNKLYTIEISYGEYINHVLIGVTVLLKNKLWVNRDYNQCFSNVNDVINHVKYLQEELNKKEML